VTCFFFLQVLLQRSKLRAKWQRTNKVKVGGAARRFDPSLAARYLEKKTR